MFEEQQEFVIKIKAPFFSFGNKKKDRKAKNQIKKYILELLEHNASFVPIYVDQDEYDGFIEDCTRKVEFKLEKE